MYLESVLSAHIELLALIEGVIFVAVIVFLPAGIVGTIGKTPKRDARCWLRSVRYGDREMSALLETKGLGKSFGHFAANADIDFSVEAGRTARGDRPERRGEDDVLQPALRHDRRRRAARSRSRATTSRG